MDETVKNLEELLETLKALRAQMIDTNDTLVKVINSSHIQSVLTIFKEGEANRV